jgi:hypothetical protein
VSKRTIVLAIGAILALVIGVQVAAFASHGDLLTLPGSNFEIDADANLAQDHDAPSIDWQGQGTTTFRSGVEWKADSDSGPLDESFGQGTKEDTAEPTVVDGSIPPNKSDLKAFGIYEEEDAFLNLFWSRVQDPSGTTNMDFELNQNYCDPDNVDPDVCDPNGLTPDRKVNDILITYDLSRGGTVATISIRKWDGSKWGPATELTAQDPVEAAGSINTSSIASSALGSLSPRTFGEAQVTFDALFGDGACGSLGSAYLKSRSSDSFTAALKDFVPPQRINISNCPATISTDATDTATLPAGQISDQATLDVPDGTDGSIQFRLYGPFTTAPSATDCTPDKLISGAGSTVTVTDHTSASNPYTSTAYTPTEAGIYQWTAQFTSATAGVESTAEFGCGVAPEQSVVSPAQSTISTAQTWVPNDTATLSQGGGTVTFTLLKNVSEPNCLTPPQGGYPQGSVIHTSGALSVPASPPHTVSTSNTTAVTSSAATGDTYRWKAAYSGTSAFNAVTTCKELTTITIDNGTQVTN